MALFSCEQDKDQVTQGIYVWSERRSYEYLDTAELKFVHRHQVKKIYCKLTDVVWDEASHATPEDIRDLPYDPTLNTFVSVVPCIFFTNEVMLKSSPEELRYIAEKIAMRLGNEKVNYKEIQIDCDWSAQSKEHYFFFLKTLQSLLRGTKISVTLRLYQYRYPDKAGVPPAARAMLMLYNFKSPQVLSQGNTIFDKAEALKYLSDKKYPLPLDFALPSFSWNLLYDAHGMFLGFIKNTNLHEDHNLFSPIHDHQFVCLADTVVEGLYLRKGNILKKEYISMKELEQARALVTAFKNTDMYTLALFDLSTQTQTLINADTDEKIFFKNTP